MQVNNHTQLSAGVFPGWSISGQQALTLVVKASYQWNDEGQLTLIPEPDIILADEYADDDPSKPIKQAGDVVSSKQGFELLIIGSAHPVNPAKGLIVQVALLDAQKSELWQKKLAVFGERQWITGIMGRSISEPTLIQQPIALCYSKAYGGSYEDKKGKLQAFEQNPTGVGFDPNDTLLPCIEQKPLIKSRRDQRPPAGFGPIAPMWAPRQEAWQQLDADAAQAGECPYPASVSKDLFNCAPIDQRFAELPPNAKYIRLQHMMAGQAMIDIALPEISLTAAVQSVSASKPKPLALTCDTLTVNSEQKTLDVLWRASVPWNFDTLPPTQFWLDYA